ncbi:MAG: hypothetical protein ACLFV3_08895 [Phycisphaeraceae bacterium]
MTSKQVMLTLVAVLLALAGCTTDANPTPRSPYAERQLWAVAPLANESGSLHADGVTMADHLARQLEAAPGVQALPVSRVLAAMESLDMPELTSPDDVQQLCRTLGADALVVGTITAYDPYDPPRLGLTIELHGGDNHAAATRLDPRELTRASRGSQPGAAQPAERGPLSTVSGSFDATDPAVRAELEDYAAARTEAGVEDPARLYLLSIDLYSEFVSHLVSSRLLQAESLRLSPTSELADDPAI